MGAFKSGCERAREWVSLELDGELSELEDALLRAHLGRCAACAAFASGVRTFTRELRAAPLEEPERVAPPAEAPKRVRVRALQVLVAAAAVAAAVGLGSLAGSLSSSSAPRHEAAAASAVAVTQQPYLEQKLLAFDPPRFTKPHGGPRVPF
jgi:anti-sigma factor RsiW